LDRGRRCGSVGGDRPRDVAVRRPAQLRVALLRRRPHLQRHPDVDQDGRDGLAQPGPVREPLHGGHRDAPVLGLPARAGDRVRRDLQGGAGCSAFGHGVRAGHGQLPRHLRRRAVLLRPFARVHLAAAGRRERPARPGDEAGVRAGRRLSRRSGVRAERRALLPGHRQRQRAADQLHGQPGQHPAHGGSDGEPPVRQPAAAGGLRRR
jgi:hypothetical protein